MNWVRIYGTIFSKLHDLQVLGNSNYTNLLSNLVGSWYNGSELQTQLNDFTVSSTLSNSAGSFSISSGSVSLTVDFTNYPSDIDVISSFSFSQINGVNTLTVFYINNLEYPQMFQQLLVIPIRTLVHQAQQTLF